MDDDGGEGAALTPLTAQRVPRYARPTMASTTGSAMTRDGIRLLTRRWAVPEGVPARAAVLLVHGLGEHSGRYEHVGDQFASAGLETHAWDHRGSGASDGVRAWVDDWSQFHDDVEDRLAAVGAAAPGLPVVLYGHSMGGLIALGYVDSEPPRPAPDLVVLSAPGIADDLARWKHVAAPILSRILPRLRIANGISPLMLSRDPDRQAAARADPLIELQSTTRLGALGFQAQREAAAGLSRLRIPTLVIQGLADPIVPPPGTEVLGTLPGVTRRTYEGVRHELHNEPEGPQVLADVIAWIGAQLGGRGTPPSEAT